MLDRPVSASFLKRWKECPLQAKFVYSLNLKGQTNGYMAFGSVAHRAFEILNNSNDLEFAIDQFERFWRNPSEMGIRVDWWPPKLNWGDCLDFGRDFLVYWDEQFAITKREVIAAEHKFKVPFGSEGYEMIGFVDLIQITKNKRGKRTLEIMDLKTSARKPTVAELGLDIQFTVYDYASHQPEFWESIPGGADIHKEFAGKDRALTWLGLKQQKSIGAGTRQWVDYERLYRIVQEIDKAVQFDVHVPTLDPKACERCDFTAECPTRIPTQDEINEASVI
jgi:hypothetical protein